MRKTEKMCVNCEPGWARTCSSCNLVSEEVICDSCGDNATYNWDDEADYCDKCMEEALDFYWSTLSAKKKAEYIGKDVIEEYEISDYDVYWKSLDLYEKIDTIDPDGSEIREV